MKLAPLQLENYFVRALRFELRAGFDSSSPAEADFTLPDFDLTTNVIQSTDDPRRCRCELHVALDDGPACSFPYTFAVSLVGMFHVSETYPEEQVALLLKVNAPSILYSAARELIYGISGRGGYAPVLLPSVSFVPNLAPPPQSAPATQETPAPPTPRKAKPRTSRKGESKTPQ